MLKRKFKIARLISQLLLKKPFLMLELSSVSLLPIITLVLAFATEKEECERFARGNDEVYQVGYHKAFWYGIFNFVANFFVYASMAVILGLGAKLYQDGKITIGEITAFLFYMM